MANPAAQKPYFVARVPGFLPTNTQSVKVARDTLLPPGGSARLYTGEWLAWHSVNNTMVRATTRATALHGGADRTRFKCFPTWLENARTDIQAVGDGTYGKVPVLMVPMGIEIDTNIYEYDAYSAVTWVAGARLMVGACTLFHASNPYRKAAGSGLKLYVVAAGGEFPHADSGYPMGQIVKPPTAVGEPMTAFIWM